MRTKAAVAASLVLGPRPCAPRVYTRVHPHVYGVCMACAQASLVLDPSISVREAHAIGASVRAAVLRQVPGLLDVDLHAELFDGSSGCEVRAKHTHSLIACS